MDALSTLYRAGFFVDFFLSSSVSLFSAAIFGSFVFKLPLPIVSHFTPDREEEKETLRHRWPNGSGRVFIQFPGWRAKNRKNFQFSGFLKEPSVYLLARS